MANIKYFSDFNGETVQLSFVYGIDNAKFAGQFPGVKGRAFDGYKKLVGKAVAGTPELPVTRWIEFKSQPSRHECNAKCLNGKHNGVCECKCGGTNHGRGASL